MGIREERQHTLEQKNSWYLKTGHIHHFLCKCGQTDSFGSILSLHHHPDHSCSQCGNTHYLDAAMFLHNPKVIRWSTFYWKIETRKTEEGWQAESFAYIPVFVTRIQKIVRKKIILSTLHMSHNGELHYDKHTPTILSKSLYNHREKARRIEEWITPQLKEALSSCVMQHPTERIAWIAQEEVETRYPEGKLTFLSFFLEHAHAKSYDLFFWERFGEIAAATKDHPTVEKMLAFILDHRKEKSLKRACFASYEQSMQESRSYSFTADYLFSRCIEDRNHLLKLLHLKPITKRKLFAEVQIPQSATFIFFLLEHYSEKQVTDFFLSMQNAGDYPIRTLRDTIWLFGGRNEAHIREHFQKVRLDVTSIHDAFAAIVNRYRENMHMKIKFDYAQSVLKAQTEKEALVYRLPETVHILGEWASYLHNCMFGYATEIHEEKSLIYGVFKSHTLTYAVEIRNDRIVQALGKYNRRIDEEDRARIDAWFKEVYLVERAGGVRLDIA